MECLVCGKKTTVNGTKAYGQITQRWRVCKDDSCAFSYLTFEEPAPDAIERAKELAQEGKERLAG